MCKPCHEQKDKGRQKFCRNGHDKDVVGRTKQNNCRECQRVSERKYKEKVKA